MGQSLQTILHTTISYYMTSYNICNIPFKLPRHRHFLSTPIEYCDGVESCLSFGRQRQHDQAIGGKTSSLHSSVLFQTPQTKRKDLNGNNSKQWTWSCFILRVYAMLVQVHCSALSLNLNQHFKSTDQSVHHLLFPFWSGIPINILL